MKKTNETKRTLENELLLNWFTWVAEGIAEDAKTNTNIVKKYIEEIKKCRGLDFFKGQEIINKFIEEIKK